MMSTENFNEKNLNIKNEEIYYNLSQTQLIEHAVRDGHGKLTAQGALVVETGAFTGRAAKDKYVVCDDLTEQSIYWDNDVIKLAPETFNLIKTEVIAHHGEHQKIYVQDRSAGAHPQHNLSVRLLTPSPTHALFAAHLFREEIKTFCEETGYTIYHAPYLTIDPEKYGTRTGTMIATSFSTREIIVLGTRYAGEIKKSIFSILNFTLPEQGVFPMHAGASIAPNDEVSVFFGLSGTGKTTLSTDVGTQLVGDDEHGLDNKGIFNFEGGCYAKMLKLTQEGEPDIYQACNRFGALLENVVIDEKTREPDYFDNTLAENSRGSYPLSFISDVVKSGQAKTPQHIFFLCCDAFGVLPPVSRLSKEQAIYYFLSGYTAKVAGTELGVTEPTATFSTCFGAPFMLRHPQEYGKLLGKYQEELGFNVWLLNTGWICGPHGVGHRISLKDTRQIVRSIQANKLNDVGCEVDPLFKLNIPKEIEGVDSKILLPWLSWEDGAAYKRQAESLAQMFQENIKKYNKDNSLNFNELPS